MKANFEVQVKNGKAYETTYREENPLEVYSRLANDLIAKKVNCYRWIKSISRVNLYNGLQRITVNYDNDTRCIYTVDAH